MVGVFMLRVATLNLRGNANRWQERFQLVVDSLDNADADVIALQEVRIKIQQHHLIRDALNSQSDNNYTTYLCEDWYEPHILANAFLVRLPIIEHERIELPEGFRTAQRILLEYDGNLINIVNTHLHHKPYRDETIRLRQMRCIFDWLSSHEAHTILLGDMNARPDTETIALAKQRMQSAYERIHHAEPPITFPTPLRAEEKLTPRTIDYIFCDKHFDVRDCQIIANQPAPNDETLYPSDHFGLVADLSY